MFIIKISFFKFLGAQRWSRSFWKDFLRMVEGVNKWSLLIDFTRLKDKILKMNTVLLRVSRSQLDIDSKKWRIRADVLNDIAMAIEILVLPHYEMHTTYILCATTSMKAIVGVAGGATRSALTQHHAIRGNLADLTSKDNSQETAVNLIASFFGLYLLTAVTSHSYVTKVHPILFPIATVSI